MLMNTINSHYQTIQVLEADRAKVNPYKHKVVIVYLDDSRSSAHLGVVWLQPCELQYCHLQLTLSLAGPLSELPIEEF